MVWFIGEKLYREFEIILNIFLIAKGFVSKLTVFLIKEICKILAGGVIFSRNNSIYDANIQIRLNYLFF